MKRYRVQTVYHMSQDPTCHRFTHNRYYNSKKGVENRVLRAIGEDALVGIGIGENRGDDMWTYIAGISPLRYSGMLTFMQHNPLLDSDKITTFFGTDTVVLAMRRQWPKWVEWLAGYEASRRRIEEIHSRFQGR